MRNGTETVDVDLVEGDADNAAAWDKAGIDEVEKPG